MGFHRLVVPTYYGGLPGGYDYANNALSGTPATIDVPRISGPNAGTYLIGFGENAIGKAVNRGLAAALENTDILDNYVHRDLAVPDAITGATGGATLASITVPGPAWVGAVGTPNTVAGIRTFITLVDDQDNEIFSGTECLVTAISGATPGDEWSAGNIDLTIAPPIPAATNYRVYFYTRSNVAGIDQDALTKYRKSSAYNGGVNWADGTANPATTITNQLDKILSDLSVTTGEDKIGGALYAGTPYALVAGTLREHIEYIVDSLNDENADMLAAVAAALATALAATAALRADITRVRFLTTADTIDTPNKDATIILNPAASFALQLPDPALTSGRQILLINGDGLMAAGNAVTLTRFATEKINNLAANFVLSAPYGRWILSCDGTDWNLV